MAQLDKGSRGRVSKSKWPNSIRTRGAEWYRAGVTRMVGSTEVGEALQFAGVGDADFVVAKLGMCDWL